MNDGAIIAACLTGTAGIVTAWAAVLRAKDKGNKDCEERLAQTRTEAETAQAELHRMKMEHPDEGEISPNLLLGLSVIFIILAVLFGILAAPPKTSGGTGGTGPPGPPGKTGPPGKVGPQGPQGLIGRIGPPGARGATGSVGSSGKNGSTGSAGVSGSTGQAGANGSNGSSGSGSGTSGSNGSNGSQGPRGATGAPGKQGPPGPPGATGSQGPKGPTGVSGTFSCPSGSSLREITLNGKGGQNTIWACVVG